MTERRDSLAHKTFPWFQSGFDLEGIVGFLAAWLLGILLGMLWGPLFWIAFIPGIILLFATRTVERVTPENPSQIITPCDGVIFSVEEADAPDELRFEGRVFRIRISSSPFSANNIHAPVSGSIDHIVKVEGEPKAVAAMKPDAEGLQKLFAVFNGRDRRVGFAVMTGGLGPRLETKCDAGDRVVVGRTIATRRLGGWCDVYVAMDAEGHAVARPGRTLIGGETAIWDFSAENTDTWTDRQEETSAAPGTDPVAPETVPASVSEAIEAGEPMSDENDMHRTDEAETEASPDTVPHEIAEEVEEVVEEEAREATPAPETVPPPVAEEVEREENKPAIPREKDGEAASMFARLRREARKLSGEDDQD